MRNKNGGPYIWVTYPEDDKLRATGRVAYAVQAFKVLPSDIKGMLSRRPRTEDKKKLRSRWIEFIKKIEYSDLEIVYLKRSGINDHEDVELYLIIHSAAMGAFGEDIYKIAASRHNLIKDSFNLGIPEYKLKPVESRAELMNVVNPFKAMYLCRIKRRHAIGCGTAPEKPFFIPVGPNDEEMKRYPLEDIDRAISSEYVYFISPFMPRNNTFKKIVNIIGSAKQNLMFSVRISTGFFGEKSIWRPLIAAHDFFKKIHREGYRLDDKFGVKELLKAYRVMLERPEDELRLMSILLASDKKIPIKTANGVAGEITRGRNHGICLVGGWDLHFFEAKAGEDSTAGISNKYHFLSDKGDSIFNHVADLRNIFHIDEAIGAFRLPYI